MDEVVAAGSDRAALLNGVLDQPENVSSVQRLRMTSDQMAAFTPPLVEPITVLAAGRSILSNSLTVNSMTSSTWPMIATSSPSNARSSTLSGTT